MNSKNYYEVLGIAPHVGSGQIQAAYRFARSLYVGESTPSYGLLDAEQRAQMLALVEEAYAALSSPNARRDYDLHASAHGTKSASRPPRESPPPAPEGSKPLERRPATRPVPAPPQTVGPLQGEPIHVPDVVNGAVLRKLRESRNLSIAQIAALSKVGGRFLKALEEDRHEALPGRVFARGFLIEYARAIRASEAEIVERYLRHWNAK